MQATISDRISLRERFLAAVHPRQRMAVAELVRQPHHGGLGLRMWLRSLAARGGDLPVELPPALVCVYLEDPEAVPLHDCADCGLAVPVHPGPRGYEDEPARAYFPTCPCCGGPTGLYAYWAAKAGVGPSTGD
ncbi:MAG: hypothetical protein ACJ8F7_01095 [Gemmataceae bacterium]